LRQEIDELKKQQTSSKKRQRLSQCKHQQLRQKMEENFRENVILMYSKTAEDLKRFIESTNTDITDLKSRQNSLASRVIILEHSFPNDGGDGSTLNEMFSLYAQEHEKEIKYINDNLAYINSNIDLLSGYRAGYNSNISYYSQILTKS